MVWTLPACCAVAARGAAISPAEANATKSRHEDEIRMSAKGEQPIPVESAKGRAPLGIETGFGERRFRIGEVALAEGVVGLEAIEAAIEQVTGGGRKRVVQAHATGHVTTALP